MTTGRQPVGPITCENHWAVVWASSVPSVVKIDILVHTHSCVDQKSNSRNGVEVSIALK